MNLSKSLKISLLALVVVSTTGSSLTLKAEEAKSTSKGTVTVSVQNVKTTLKYGFKFGEAMLPYAAIIAYCKYLEPQILGLNYVKDDKGLQNAFKAIAKCVLGGLFFEKIKAHTKVIKNVVSEGFEAVGAA